MDSGLCLNELTKCYNTVIESGETPQNWAISLTKLIPKITKPTAADLRPIALTDTIYKTFMGVLREKIEKHMQRNNLFNDLQSGFTKSRRITDNLYILKHCVERTYLLKKELIVVSVDFQKAFDSVSRSELIKALMSVKIDALLINIVAQIYTKDKTNLYIENKMQTQIEVTSGIRQGCNGSTIFFLLITYVIIEKLQETGLGYEDNLIKIVALFFADGENIGRSKKDD